MVTALMSTIPTWEALFHSAGPPAPRPTYTEKVRLFGAAVPMVRLWHDSAAWDPFSAQVWLLLEEMKLPYERKTIPLECYLKPGEEKSKEWHEWRRLVPKGSTPAIQFANKSALMTGKVEFGPIVQVRRAPGIELGIKLTETFPSHALLPRTPKRRAYAAALLQHLVQLQTVVYSVLAGRGRDAEVNYITVLDDFERALGGNKGSDRGRVSIRSYGDDGDGDEAHFGGPMNAGPFLFGRRPSAIDIIMLPMIERCEATVPHPSLGASPHLSLARWPAIQLMLRAARTPGVSAYSEIGSDAHTLVGIRFTVTGMYNNYVLPPLAEPLVFAEEAVTLDYVARKDAASRLCSNHVKVAGFACKGRGLGRPRTTAPKAAVSPAGEGTLLVGVTEEALRAVAALLLQGDIDGQALRVTAAGVAAQICKQHGPVVASQAGSALQFLAENTGVPRDMAPGPGHAFRVFLALVAASLFSVASTVYGG